MGLQFVRRQQRIDVRIAVTAGWHDVGDVNSGIVNYRSGRLVRGVWRAAIWILCRMIKTGMLVEQIGVSVLSVADELRSRLPGRSS